MNVTVLSGQSLVDLAVQTAGSAESVLQMAIANGISITDKLSAGSKISSVAVANKPVHDYYQNRQLEPATGIMSEQIAISRGIGFMSVGVDFIVS